MSGITVGVLAVGAVNGLRERDRPKGKGNWGRSDSYERDIQTAWGSQIAMSEIDKRLEEEKTDCASGVFKGHWVWGQG